VPILSSGNLSQFLAFYLAVIAWPSSFVVCARIFVNHDDGHVTEEKHTSQIDPTDNDSFLVVQH
jgi:hypothetical protein